MIRSQQALWLARRQLVRLEQLQKRIVRMAADFSIDASDLTTLIDKRKENLNSRITEYESALYQGGTANLAKIADLPNFLITARLSLGWTQTELARLSGLRVQQINKYEKQKYASIKLSKAIALAEMLSSALAEMNPRICQSICVKG